MRSPFIWPTTLLYGFWLIFTITIVWKVRFIFTFLILLPHEIRFLWQYRARWLAIIVTFTLVWRTHKRFLTNPYSFNGFSYLPSIVLNLLVLGSNRKVRMWPYCFGLYIYMDALLSYLTLIHFIPQRQL